MKNTFKKITCALLLLASVGCANGSTNEDDGVTTVSVGVVGEYNDQWDTVNALLKDQNIQVELVKFSEYTAPNRALDEGSIDMNAFQTHTYLEDEIEKLGYDITPIGDTILAPLAMFPNTDKISSVEEIKDGDTIAIPSDTTNGGRALKLLEAAGLITVDPAAGYTPTVMDITEYHVDIEIVTAESATLANLLPDCTAAIINGGNAVTAGLNPVNDGILMEDITTIDNVDSLRNCIVVRSEDAENEVYQAVVAAYQTAEVEQTLQDSYGGAFIPAWK